MLCSLRVGDRIDLIGPLPQQAPDDISVLVVGFSETITHFEHRLTFNCAPESPWRVVTLDDPVLGRLDTEDSSLTADYTSADTSLVVQTNSGPVWVDSATYPTHFPFDIRVSGEVMTVTAITGTTSPQTFTVTRSVNSVSKAQTTDTAVSLATPTLLAL